MYKVAVIGSTGRGNFGHGLDAVWKTTPNCQVVAVADDHPIGLKEAIGRTGAAKGYANYREMLDKERPNIVAVCPRWTDQHRDMALACAEHGAHMYMEKPFCRDLTEADEIIKACEMRHIKIAVAHIARYSPQLQVVKDLIAAGEIGTLVEIRTRGKEDARGGGEDLWVLGSHVLDSLRAIAGDALTCQAMMSEGDELVTAKHVKPGAEGLGPLAGDRVEASYRFPNGVVGTFSSKRKAGGTPSRFGMRIFGSKGVIDMASGYGLPAYLLKDSSWQSPTVNAKWQTITSNGLDKPETITATGYDGGNPAVVRDLIAAIEEDRQPKCGMYEARATIEMIMAIFESHRLGKIVPLPLENRRQPLSFL
ncbi:MAG: Gfo/Idh/MocA family oxidoreductase [Pirellulaceae bacterium]|nr:Gfo/Idh/MocA family oxidoreductase [Pirellulaceae bacterium]